MLMHLKYATCTLTCKFYINQDKLRSWKIQFQSLFDAADNYSGSNIAVYFRSDAVSMTSFDYGCIGTCL